MTQKAGSAGFSVCFVFCFFFYLPPLNHMFLHEFSIWQSLSFFPWHRPKAGVLISKCGMLTVASYKSFPLYRYNYLFMCASAPFWCLCQKLSLSPLYFNKTLLHKSSEWSSLVSGPGLNSSPPGAKNPGVFVWFNNNLSSWGLVQDPSGQDGS